MHRVPAQPYGAVVEPHRRDQRVPPGSVTDLMNPQIRHSTMRFEAVQACHGPNRGFGSESPLSLECFNDAFRIAADLTIVSSLGI
jgi:hypothetical protein